MNVQYAIKDGEIYVLEVNPRASRTVPFVAKTIGLPIAKIAARIMAGENLDPMPSVAYGTVPRTINASFNHIAVKEAVFPFSKFPGVDTLLGPEMRSTGEVMGLDRDYACGVRQGAARRRRRPAENGRRVHLGQATSDKPNACVDTARLHRAAIGFRLMATGWHPADYLGEQGVEVERRSTRCWKAVRISRTRSATGRCRSCINTTEGKPRRMPIPSRCAAPR
jgi:carbamoyl-phosphate synthase large subunit